MKRIYFKIYGNIKPKERPKFTTINGYGRAYTSKKQSMSETLVADSYIREAEKHDFCGFGENPVEMELVFHEPIPTSASKKKKLQMLSGKIVPTKHNGDLDNRIKTICDGLNHANVWKDDCVVVSIKAKRMYDESEYAEVTLSEYQPKDETYNESVTRNIPESDEELCL